jgi:UDP-N-acetylglucosamine 4,6-dehydratase
MLNGKSLLVTGGTGSFGKSFIRMILEKHPEIDRIVVFSRDEFKQFQMSNLPWIRKDKKIRFFIGDVRDKDRLLRAFDGIDIVVHAAALKQIPSCEYNPFEAIKTNILGAQNVIDAAIDRNVRQVVALSTDKACNPVNLYGATKLCSDKLFITGNAYSGRHSTIFSVVRYGNVAGSRGSVIPFFKQLVASGAHELPITDRRMTRFWLKLEEAVELVLIALRDMRGGELFVRKTPSIEIVRLAEAIAPSLPLREVGIRPGEKIHEMMISREDARNTVEFEKYFIIQPDFEWWHRNRGTLKGKRVPDDFEYHSGNNTMWLSVDQIRALIDKLEDGD